MQWCQNRTAWGFGSNPSHTHAVCAVVTSSDSTHSVRCRSEATASARRRFRYAPISNNQRLNLLSTCHRAYLTALNYEQCSALYRSIRIRVLYVPQLNHVVGGLLLLYAPTHQPCSWWPPITPAKLHYYLILVIAPYPCFLSWISKKVLEKYQKLLFMGMWCTT
jgi:hypothetical protein